MMSALAVLLVVNNLRLHEEAAAEGDPDGARAGAARQKLDRALGRCAAPCCVSAWSRVRWPAPRVRSPARAASRSIYPWFRLVLPSLPAAGYFTCQIRVRRRKPWSARARPAAAC